MPTEQQKQFEKQGIRAGVHDIFDHRVRAAVENIQTVIPPHFDRVSDLAVVWACETFRDAITQAARAVGFRMKTTDLHSYVEHLLEVLSQSQSNVAA